MKKTFIIVSATFPPHMGGVEHYSHGMARELACRGHRVIVITSMLDGLSEYEQYDDIAVFRLPTKWFFDMRMPIFLPGRAWKNVKAQLKNETCPTVIIQTYLYPLSLVMATFSRKMGFNTMLINHGCNYVCRGNIIMDKMEHLYERIMAHWVGRKCSRCYAVSDVAGEWLRSMGLPYDGKLPPAINTAVIAEMAEPQQQESFEFPQAEPNALKVAFVGRVIKEKGICQLVNAVTNLRERGLAVSLFAVGDGPLLESLNKQSTENIYFLGRLENRHVIRLLSQCDCHCIPSDSEGFSISTLEAGACGCYNVLAPFSGAKEIIPDETYGYRMNDNSQYDIEMALSYVYENREQCKQVALNCRQKVLSEYTWQTVCEKMIHSLERTADGMKNG